MDTTMPSLECFRQFFNQRLAAAAEEIFREFEKTMVEYEEEIIRQRKLLTACLKPEVKLHRIDQPQQHVCMEEEAVSNQKMGNQEDSGSLDQEEADPPQIKEEQEELCTIPHRQELILKQETDNIMLTSACEENDHSEDQTVCFNTLKVSEEPEPNTDQQVLHHTPQNGDSVSVRNKKPKPKRTRRSNTVQQYTTSKTSRKNPKGEKSFHTGKRPFSCKFCDKNFRDGFNLRRHTGTHMARNNIIVASAEDFMRFNEIS